MSETVTTPQPRETLLAVDVRRWARPFVYGWRRGEQYLYIGATKRGLPRLLENHMAFLVGEDIREGDVIDLWQPEFRGVFELERELIQTHRPKLNGKVVKTYHARRRAAEESYRARYAEYEEKLAIWKRWEESDHDADEHCDVDENQQCRVCGWVHGDPCPQCGGRAFHRDGCTSTDVARRPWPPTRRDQEVIDAPR